MNSHKQTVGHIPLAKMSTYDNGPSLGWQNNFYVTTIPNISKLQTLRAGGPNCGLKVSLPFKEKFSFFLHLTVNDVVSFCWLLLIKGRGDEDQGWKNYNNSLLPNTANIVFFFF